VTVATPDNVQAVVASGQPEYMTESLSTNSDGSMAIENLSGASFSKILSGKTVLAVGPGLGQSSGTQKFIRALVQSTELPVILDADG
jgi:NAD(P)H-hydrate epimerase